ncbi:ribosomal protein S7 domain-containing protein [Amanita rubescens]|nr:ribosomal protein S7 domain-containing protein [Amanita rubescens]
MLASIVARSLSPSIRALSTAIPAKTSTQLTNTLATIGVPSLPPSKQRPSLPSVPDVPDIPPAEDPLLHYVTSNIMQGGRRAKASRITSKTLLYIHTLTREPPLPLFRKAIELAAPAVRIVNNSWGAKSVPTPLPLSEKQRTRYAVRWILKASNGKPGRTLEERLARELIAVVRGQSAALDDKLRVHKSAMINRGNVKRIR